MGFLYKLDYAYFFTDEILYVQRGVEHIQGIYHDNLQVAPFQKYLAGAVYLAFNHNTFLLRFPYVFMGIFSAFIIYLIIKENYNKYLGLVGAILFSTSTIILNATRMVMLEPMLHLVWLLFHFFYFKAVSLNKNKHFLLAGIFLGLSFLAKITSLVLIPFTMVFMVYAFTKSKNYKQIAKRYILMLLTAVSTVFVGYTHFFIKEGFIDTIVLTLKAMRDTYITRNTEGKLHVIGDNVYEKSPWWAYLYYFKEQNGILRILYYTVLAMSALISRSLYAFYWGTFLFLILIFNQMLGLKSTRYISSIEIPLIMLSVAGLHWLAKSGKHKVYLKSITIIMLCVFTLHQIYYLKTLEYTEYLGLWKYFKEHTQEFTVYKRIYVFGSVRSMKWYRDLVPNKDMWIYRKDYEIMCPEFDGFDYLAFDKEELLKDPTNFLYSYYSANKENYTQVNEIKDMYVYKKVKNFGSKLPCPN